VESILHTLKLPKTPRLRIPLYGHSVPSSKTFPDQRDLCGILRPFAASALVFKQARSRTPAILRFGPGPSELFLAWVRRSFSQSMRRKRLPHQYVRFTSLLKASTERLLRSRSLSSAGWGQGLPPLSPHAFLRTRRSFSLALRRCLS
jgi:hypothetical protein